MNNVEKEIFSIGGEVLVELVRKELKENFFIIVRDAKILILGNAEKTVKFSRKNFRVMDRCNIAPARTLSRVR